MSKVNPRSGSRNTILVPLVLVMVLLEVFKAGEAVVIARCTNDQLHSSIHFLRVVSS